ncbi:putative membrane protein YphA (DoxX/SURF4 family) [Actinoplanes lutulentus]|uniref:DoxX-like protein n=1 Tax=Actinoplanes lutulentus TaxID=1287878 RepID=A0A327ZA83_9ACTN|nr:DoxX family protein [Actinoplanes lutulentus]MBB2946712.1 putative membrane protein YphA (DoxX/SURF4 family) [Actinoplanes lutulentus]RAK35604.1 DoxX-like protein [Actinoplanes lutulentus]
MNTALWIVAGLLATVFTIAGLNKLILSQETLAKAPGGGWVLDFSPRFLKILGTLEILGAAGLILPAVLGIAPILVPLAAVGIAAIMLGAAIVIYRRGEYAHLLINIIYLSLATFVAVGRLGPEPFII